MNNLEQLVSEYYDWKDYLIKRNIHVGKRPAGGYEMELDLVAYQPHANHLIHIETSLDSYSWAKRKDRFSKKFERGSKYIFEEVFTWLDHKTKIDQLIVLPTKPSTGMLDGVKVITVDEQYSIIINEIKNVGKANRAAIPEQYFLLRTIQFCVMGYHSSPLEFDKAEET